MQGDDRRIHARIETDLPCNVTAGGEYFQGRIRDLSHGGAQILGPVGVADLKDSLEIEIELPGDPEPIAVLGEVCRVQPEGGQARYGVRFAVIEPRQRDQIIEFIDSLLAGRGIGVRQHPRVHRRVEVVCRTQAQTRAVMSNISQGGLALTCSVPLVLDEEITVEVRVERLPAPFELRGRVAHVRTIPAADGSNVDSYQAGVKFEALAPERQAALGELIKFLMRTTAG